ncbi:MAG: primosomal protein N', partial [Myxococcota bacterium]
MAEPTIREPSLRSPVADDARLRRARVVLSAPVGLLDYRIPPALAGDIALGVAVRVPLGKQQTSAYVVEIVDGPAPVGIKLRDIDRLDAERPRLPDNLIRLVLFAADYYRVTPGDMLTAALPAAGRRATIRYRITDDGSGAVDALKTRAPDRELLRLATRFPRGFTVAAVERDLNTTRRRGSARLKRLTDRGWLTRVTRSHGPRTATAYERVAGADPTALGARQKAARALFELVPTEGSMLASELAKKDRGAYGKLKTLEKAGLVRRIGVAQRLQPHAFDEVSDVPPVPTADQATAIDAICDAIDADRFQTFLVHGVTGSGKTEIYLRVIEHALAKGRSALVLVPEIALTPQLGARFRARFGDQVATFHSALTVAERRDEWDRVAEGKAVIGLGARSALFLPLSNLGVLVVDEEHETSFKQDESPRYNARDLAVVRGQHEKAVVVLGSATPSLESRTNANAERYAMLSLPTRVKSRPMPEVTAVDLARSERVGCGVFTERLATAVEETLSADRQVILFLNRRGFAPYIYCRDCGHAFRCPDCDVSLTLHRRRDALICHYCGFQAVTPDECPSCHSHKVISYGLGTERVEAEIAHLFGNVPTARLDRDTVRRRADLDRTLQRFACGDAKILVGTQMVA